MRVHFALPAVRARALARVEQALIRYAPASVSLDTDPRAADLVVVHVVGRRDKVADDTERYTRRGQRYAILQYVLRSTQKSSTADWIEIWRHAAVVLSYYDLVALCHDDLVQPLFPFYHTPLGADPDVFSPRPVPKTYVVGTSGHGWLTESVRECVVAARQVHRPAFHLGRNLHRKGVVCETNISDDTLATRYSQCDWVSGLRREEGFELPCVEGILCGSRPVLFETPSYRRWYDGLADFLPERPRPEVVASLTRLFQRGPRLVTDTERREAARRFDWSAIAQGFWARVL